MGHDTPALRQVTLVLRVPCPRGSGAQMVASTALAGCLKSYCVRGTELLFAAHQLPRCMWRLPCAAAGLPGSPEVAAGASLPMESCSLEMSLAAW